MIPSKSLPVSTTYKEVLRRLDWDSLILCLCTMFWLCLWAPLGLHQGFRPTGAGDANLFWSWGAELPQEYVRTPRGIVRAQPHTDRPAQPGSQSWPVPCWGYMRVAELWGWLSAPDSVAVPLLHVRRVFTHCLPQQELHCTVKFTTDKRWEKQILSITWKLLYLQKQCEGKGKERRLFVWMMFICLCLSKGVTLNVYIL